LEVPWKEGPFITVCQFWQEDPVANNDTLAKILDAKYLILCQTALSQHLGHPDAGHDEAVFKLAKPWRSHSKQTSQK
jgi:hypothetical protein